MQFRQLIETKEQELLDVLKKQLKKTTLEAEQLQQDNSSLEAQCSQLEMAHQNNLNVIEEIEHENAIIKDKAIKIKKESDAKDALIRELNQRITSIQGRHQGQTRAMKADIQKITQERDHALAELNTKANKSDQTKLIIQKLELKHKMEMQQVSQFAAQKIRNEETQSNRALSAIKNETQKTIRDLKIKLQSLVTQNRQLLESNNTLKANSLQKETALNQKIEKLQRISKQSEYCKGIYEQQLQNIKRTSEDWQSTLKDKIKILQAEKQQLIEQLAQYKFQKKQKTRELKQQFAQKVDELIAEKTRSMKRYEQVVRDTKIENQKLIFANSQFKKQLSDFERNKKSYEEQVENRMNQYMKAAEQDRKFAKNELELKQQRVFELERQLADAHKINTDQKTIIQKLKETFDKRTNEHEALKLQFNKYKTIMREKLMKQQHQAPKQQEKQYSQYFSEDMGPIDSNWFERNSNANANNMNSMKKQQPEVVLKEVYDNKKLEALQKQNSELKDIISRMSREMQDTRDTLSMKMELKEKQIRLAKDENYMLRDKINEKEQEILRTKERLNQTELELGKTQQRIDLLQQNESQTKGTKKTLQKIESQFNNLRQELDEALEHNRVLLQQRENLISISNELRAQLNYIQQQIQNAQPSMMLGLSSNKPGEKRVSDASVRQINKMLEGNVPNIESEIYIPNKTKKPEKRLSPNQPTVIKNRQNRNMENTPSRKPQSLANLIKQRKKLMRQQRNRQPFKMELVAEQVELLQPKKDRINVQTQSQKQALEKIRKKSKQKETMIQERLRPQIISNRISTQPL